MKVDFTIKFRRNLHEFLSVDSSEELQNDETEKYFYTIVIVDNSLGKRVDTSYTTEAESIPGEIFRFLTLEENTLDIDESFYEKYFVGWYSLDGDVKKFLTPTKMERLYEHMLNRMRENTDDKGILKLYFELV